MGREKFAILVVEDQEVNRQILRQILQGEYDILEAENGLEALAVLGQHRTEKMCSRSRHVVK